MTDSQAKRGRIGVAPLVGNQESDEANALGALLAELLLKHLRAAGLPTLPHRTLVEQIVAREAVLPLDSDSAAALAAVTGLRALVYGRYVIDMEGKLFGMRLEIAGPDADRVPMEASTPFASFARFIERIGLALVEALGAPIDEATRRRVGRVYCPSDLEACRQLARAHVTWARGQHELALAAVSSALAIDPEYEDAVRVEVALARAAGDSATVRDAFQRWSRLAVRRGRPTEGAERLLLLGHWLVEQGEWDEARATYDGARTIFRREGDRAGEARALNNAANLDLMTGRTQSAIKTYRRSLRAFEGQVDRRRDEAIALLNLGLSHRNQGQRDEAMLAAEEALSVARQSADRQIEGRARLLRGTIYAEMGEWTRAGDDYDRAEQALQAIGDRLGLAELAMQRALLSKQRGDTQKAERLLREASQTLERAGGLHDQGLLWLNLADLYLSMRLYEQAWRYARRAHDALGRLKSDYADQAAALLETLEEISQEQAAQAAVSPEPPVDAPDLDGDSGGLYKNPNLYNNEVDNRDSSGGDVDVKQP